MFELNLRNVVVHSVAHESAMTDITICSELTVVSFTYIPVSTMQSKIIIHRVDSVWFSQPSSIDTDLAINEPFQRL